MWTRKPLSTGWVVKSDDQNLVFDYLQELSANGIDEHTEEYTKDFERADEAFQEGDFPEAIKILKQVMERAHIHDTVSESAGDDIAPEDILKSRKETVMASQPWVIKVKGATNIQFDGDGRIRLWLTDEDFRDHKKVREVDRMTIPYKEKIHLLESQEQDIVFDVATDKYIAMTLYAEKSQGIKIDGELGTPTGSVDWEAVLGVNDLEESAPETAPQEPAPK